MGYHEQLITLGLTVVSLSWILHVCFSSRPFYDKRISAEVGVDFLGDEWKVWLHVLLYQDGSHDGTNMYTQNLH